jgi:hypothetical protein
VSIHEKGIIKRVRKQIIRKGCHGNGLGFVTNQDVVVGQLVDPFAITFGKLCISFNSGKVGID